MLTFILIIIYLSFISLGLPDSLLGSVWPVMHMDLQIPLSMAGMISMIITGGTIISSFMSGRLIARFGTGKLTCVSVLMTAASLIGFSISGSVFWICLFAIPLGLGAGAVDSALNSFVALHYQAKHMSWLHCFWGVGATSGPLIMSAFLVKEQGWRNGYFIISCIQFFLAAILFFTLPLWKSVEQKETEDSETVQNRKKQNLFSIPIIRVTLFSFFCYCAIEMTVGLWGSSYLVSTKGISAELAARWVSLFYFGITLGRFLSGFLSIKISDHNLIRLGEVIIITGLVLFLLPLQAAASMIGFICVGLGCAPIYPCMLHDTPNKVGKELSQSMMGIQMAFAYVGSTVMPPVFGLLAGKTGTWIFPVYLAAFIILMVLCTEQAKKYQKFAEF